MKINVLIISQTVSIELLIPCALIHRAVLKKSIYSLIIPSSRNFKSCFVPRNDWLFWHLSVLECLESESLTCYRQELLDPIYSYGGCIVRVSCTRNKFTWYCVVFAGVSWRRIKCTFLRLSDCCFVVRPCLSDVVFVIVSGDCSPGDKSL
jgi:hypothetical protein